MNLKEWVRFGALALFVGIALIRFDLVVKVTFRTARVEQVQVGPGGKLYLHRRVTIRIGEQLRILSTSDPLIPTPVGGLVCVAETQMLLRTFTRYVLENPLYCPGLRHGTKRLPGVEAAPLLLPPGG